MIEFNIDEKRIIIAILITIMEADGIIDPHEIDYLDSIILSFGMPAFFNTSMAPSRNAYVISGFQSAVIT